MQSAAYEPAQSWEAGTKLSAITVEFMFLVVTHSGVRRDDVTLRCEVGSTVVPLVRLAGGFFPSRR